MRSPHPTPAELLRLLDGEVTENRSHELRAHLQACPACATEHAAQERLVAQVAAPVPGLPAGGGVEALLRRLDEAPVVPIREAPARWRRAAVSLAALAAAALVVLALRPGPRRDDFSPRGGAVEWTRKVGVELWVLDGAPRRLVPGELLPRGPALVASFSNADAAPAFLLAFAVDGQGEVHWLYPGWLEAGTDPEAVRLEPSTMQRALAESVVLEGLPAGPLRLVTVVTRAPLHVSDVERLPAAGRSAEALRSRWPEARIEELAVRNAESPAAPRGRP